MLFRRSRRCPRHATASVASDRAESSRMRSTLQRFLVSSANFQSEDENARVARLNLRMGALLCAYSRSPLLTSCTRAKCQTSRSETVATEGNYVGNRQNGPKETLTILAGSGGFSKNGFSAPGLRAARRIKSPLSGNCVKRSKAALHRFHSIANLVVWTSRSFNHHQCVLTLSHAAVDCAVGSVSFASGCLY